MSDGAIEGGESQSRAEKPYLNPNKNNRNTNQVRMGRETIQKNDEMAVIVE